MKVRELKNILSKVSDEVEVRPYVKDLEKKVQFWYFDIGDADIKEDGVYIELI